MLMLFYKIYHICIKKKRYKETRINILMHEYYNIQYSKFRIQIKRIQIIENIQTLVKILKILIVNNTTL